MTALSMVESMWAEGHRALVQTAAASSLGQMLIRVCAEDDIPLVNVVRSPAQVARLREVGAEYVCDTTAANFEVDLTAALKATGATIAFDAVGGGGLADRILACMERAISDGAPYQDYGSAVHKQVYLYGFLERSPAVLHRAYGASWSVGGWLMPRALQRAGSERVAALRARVAAGLTTTFATEFTDEVTLTGALQPEAIATYGRPTTGTKFLVRPSE
jgi:NADPH:quinone reductase-like Zn-dependent oxidoreductase